MPEANHALQADEAFFQTDTTQAAITDKTSFPSQSNTPGKINPHRETSSSITNRESLLQFVDQCNAIRGGRHHHVKRHPARIPLF